MGRRRASTRRSTSIARRRPIPTTCVGSTDADLRAFFARGGKLLLYHGWSDPQVTPYNTINFFQKVVAAQGGAGVGTSVQLYMVPGMNHCTGGPGTDTFDKVAAIESWIDDRHRRRRASTRHTSPTASSIARGRCARSVRWRAGTARGSTDVASSFSCVAATLDAPR